MRIWITAGLTLCALWGAATGASALEVPPLGGRVNDTAGMLSPQERERLEQKLAAYEQDAGHQFALLTVPSLEGQSIEGFSIEVAEVWKLGDEKREDGLILVVAQQDRKMRIEVGYGLEGDVPDAIASRVIREVLQPAFRAGNYFGGINQAFEVLHRAAGGEAVALTQSQPQTSSRRRAAPSAAKKLFWVMLMGFWLVPMFFGRRRRGLGRGGFFIGGMGGMGGGGGFGGGGGGGFSGGGGGFGGGGASGGW